MKRNIILLSIMFSEIFISCSNYESSSVTDINYVSKVNTLIGRDSEYSLSNGNTYPAIALPWGMNFWTLQTALTGNNWMYAYDAKKINGFRQTHQASNWLGDYGCFSIFPIKGELKIKEEERASWFSHKAEIAKPHYYKVYLADYDVTTEITPTERAARFRFTFPESDNSYVIIDGLDRGAYVKIIPEERKIIGYTKYNSGSVPENFHNYFVAVFDKDFEYISTWNGDVLNVDNHSEEGKQVGAIIGFKTKRGEQVNLKVASSFISHEQAELNLEKRSWQ